MPVSETPSRPPMVLVANDQEWSSRSLESILGPNGYAVLRAYTGRQALELATSAQPDIIILDARLPDMDGVDVCRQLRGDPAFSAHTPIIITTSGPAGRAQRLTAYQSGAWEFCSQPLDGEVLLLKLETFMRSKRQVDRLNDESLLDQLTGLYNVRGLARRAREIGAEAYRRHDPLACVAFAPETDNAELSDKLMDEIAGRLAEHLGTVIRRSGRTSDAFGRLGHSEFAIIAPATEAKGAVRLVERIQEMIAASPVPFGSATRPMTIRAGYCAVPDFAESSVDAVEMLLRAATALRHVRSSPVGDPRIAAFDDVPVKFVS